MIIGLTGNIASGKSTIAKLLEELGAQVIDTDQLARQVVEPDTPALKEIVNFFGPGILHGGGSLDRTKLAELIYKDPTAKKRLEQIVHPAIEKELISQIKLFKDCSPKGILVLQIPLLIEVGWQNKVDQVWLVKVDLQTQIHRLINRDKLSPEQAMARINSQMPQSQKAKHAHIVIDNSDSIEETRQQVLKAWHKEIEKSIH
ncbi:dephospho-CoA kinase [Desulforamulus aquiferis]|uniref:Dephospho-CoA kinase n=1 Tax=Desulforamulus aquiferis TaxID=1397668 RepID=A0AAW7ZBX1_9FIRM|nr:dephospho-CoA kinase [Desulforamulus aquiferis]MDO7786714.1 dephospho-CoA kinase [Desulforamulus aquiferis]RYD06863.1 hypothetical protein N752_01680 [Desulforamulus aquiferis]